MRYKCNACEQIINIDPHVASNTAECAKCGMKYNAEIKTIASKTSDGSTTEKTGVQVPDLQGKP